MTPDIIRTKEGVKNGETEIHSGIQNGTGHRNVARRKAHQLDCSAGRDQSDAAAKLEERVSGEGSRRF